MFPTCSEVLEVVKRLGYVKSPSAEATDQPADEETAAESASPQLV
jgi:hypothetical protein